MRILTRSFALRLITTGVTSMISGCANANDTRQQQTSPCPFAQKVNAPTLTGAREQTMKIRLKLESTTLNATLEDNAAARDFFSLLPLTLKDYAETEKVSDLPKKLSTEGAPASMTPVAGDITFYAPWESWRCFTRMATIRADSSNWEKLMRVSKP